MELVVVNGASNISKRVIQSLIKGGQYNKVRLLDFKPYHQHVYAFQRELNSQGIQVDKRITTNGAALDIALEGASKVVYFTHDYTSLVSDKNNFLVGTAKLAKKHGVKNLVAVLPVEHDLAYTEEDDKTWVQVRHEAEQTALQASKAITILNSDLVYSTEPSHLLHYVAQRVAAGSIASPFLSNATFNPVSSCDVASAVAHVLANGGHGQYALRGAESITINELVNLIEKSSGKSVGSTTKARSFGGQLIEEFITGLTVEQNLSNLVHHFEVNPKESAVRGLDFFQTNGLNQTSDVRQFYNKTQVAKDSLALPSQGDYSIPFLNF